jgi:hypothetical protein
MIYVLNFIFNSFITLKFTFEFHLIYGQIRPNQDLTKKRTRKGNEIYYLTKLTYYHRVHYSDCKFYMLTRVNIMCRLFILPFFYLIP